MDPPAPFIVGVERSGTTLLRMMLDAHPALAIPFETHFLNRLVEPAPSTAEAFLAVVTGSPAWPNLGVGAEALRAAVLALAPFSAADGVRAFYRLAAARFGKPRWGDKTPSYLRRMPAIGRLLPEARFVHLIRDGRDAAVSSRGLWFGPGGRPQNAARAWVEQIEQARRDAAVLPHYLEVRYEDLVRSPEATLKTVCGFIELPYDDAMPGYHRGAEARLADVVAPFGPNGAEGLSPRAFAAIHAKTREPPDPRRIGRWKAEMSPRDQRRFERIAGPLLRRLGYETGA